MEVFFTLLINLIPLYILIGLGFIAGRYCNVDRVSLANLAIFIVMPVIAFGFIADLEFHPVYTTLPFLIFGMSALIGLAALMVGRRIFRDNRANLMAMCASEGNTGYLGLPLVLLLFDPQWVGVYMLMNLGVVIYEITIVYYMAARGQFSARQSLIKLLKFPAIYAIAAGLCVNALQVELPDQFFLYRDYFKGAYVIIGMMIIGVALSQITKLQISFLFIACTFIGKFLVWPIAVLAFVYFDKMFLTFFSSDIHALMIVLSIAPPAANITAFAAQLDLKPDKAATTVLLATIFALFYIPAALVLLGLH